MMIPMSPQGSWTQDKISFYHLSLINQAIADFDEKVSLKPADYHHGSLDDCIPAHLTPHQSSKLCQLLQKHESLFQGKLGTMPGEPYKIQVHPYAKPYHSRVFQYPISILPFLMKGEM
jgi:hypothetical protein